MSRHSHQNSHGSGGSRNPRITVQDDWYDDLGQEPTGDIMSMGEMSDAWDEEKRNYDLEPASVAGNSAYSGHNRLQVGHTLTGVDRRLGGSQPSTAGYQRSFHYSTTSATTGRSRGPGDGSRANATLEGVDNRLMQSELSGPAYMQSPRSYASTGYGHRNRNSRDINSDFGPHPTRVPSPHPAAFEGIGQGVRVTPGNYPQPGYGSVPVPTEALFHSCLYLQEGTPTRELSGDLGVLGVLPVALRQTVVVMSMMNTEGK